MMDALTLRDIAASIGAAYEGDLTVRRVCTDSRSVAPGDLYVALVGERFDGNQFIAQAAAAGACAAVVSRPGDARLPQLQVTDTRRALGEIARLNRRAFRGPLIAVTGSAGKTTVKNMLAAIFAVDGPVLATEGNFNNEIGVPLTLLRLAPEHRAAVIEMGAARAGDIAYLCQFAEPDVGVITNALAAHIQSFGDIAGVARTKGEIYSSLGPKGVAVINADAGYCSLWRNLAGARRQILFGLSESADVRATDLAPDARGQGFMLHFEGRSAPVRLPLLGRHNVVNALAAAAAALAVGTRLEQIVEGLASVRA
ncbi:MAG TPA: UDP-N-acetylmuramoyl-tripeptide--D-alanyl-D-alanine ligase, partial [Spongiibacteraceae bacterium]|nr:UDP-N-acetylmuramoyl-tripeptide--D-alanyl-D-alanine ligase [Spongiibacteraceae bacterium]